MTPSSTGIKLTSEERRETVRRYGFEAFTANNYQLDTRGISAAQLHFLRSPRENFDPQDAMYNRKLGLYIRVLDTAQCDATPAPMRLLQRLRAVFASIGGYCAAS